MDDDLWEVALPSGEVKRMTLDQLDRAFQIGLIHANTLVREGNGGDWQSLGAVAGLEDEPPTAEAATTRAPDSAQETKRNSVLPMPPDEDPNRETLAGLGGFLNVGSRGPMPKQDLPPRAATLPMGAPAPVVVSQGSTPNNHAPNAAASANLAAMKPAAMKPVGARPPSLPENAFGPVASVTGPSIRPPLPPNAFGGPSTAAAPAPFIPTASVQRGSAAPVQPLKPAPIQAVSAAPAALAAPRTPAFSAQPAAQPVARASGPAPALGSAPPAPRHSGPPPLPPGAFSPSQQPPPMPSRPPAPATTAPSFPPLSGPSPVPVVQNLAPAATMAHAGPAPGSRAANLFIVAFALSTLLIILHRNGALYDVCSKLGLGATYSSLEQGLLGPPSELTPRGVQALEATVLPGASVGPEATP